VSYDGKLGDSNGLGQFVPQGAECRFLGYFRRISSISNSNLFTEVFTMIKTKRLLAMLLVVISLMVFTVVPASTAPIQSALDLGFTLDSSVYTAT
jgi:hypothetical protein